MPTARNSRPKAPAEIAFEAEIGHLARPEMTVESRRPRVCAPRPTATASGAANPEATQEVGSAALGRDQLRDQEDREGKQDQRMARLSTTLPKGSQPDHRHHCKRPPEQRQSADVVTWVGIPEERELAEGSNDVRDDVVLPHEGRIEWGHADDAPKERLGVRDARGEHRQRCERERDDESRRMFDRKRSPSAPKSGEIVLRMPSRLMAISHSEPAIQAAAASPAPVPNRWREARYQ